MPPQGDFMWESEGEAGWQERGLQMLCQGDSPGRRSAISLVLQKGSHMLEHLKSGLK